jgi:hypothetical protein
MRYWASQSVLWLLLVSAGASAIGGCPLPVPVDEATLTPAPGTYFVEQREDKLYYYDLAVVRGAEGRWVALDDDGMWFTGPGFYELSEDHVWSRDEDTEGLTLDEVIQLHDPPPAVPE